MTEKMVLNEDIIKSFNECVKTGNYKPFLEENKPFLDKLGEILRNAEFSQISEGYRFYEWYDYCLNFLRNPTDPNYPPFRVPHLLENMQGAVNKKDWTSFHQFYRPKADYIVRDARLYGILDFKIEYNSKFFENFQMRDNSIFFDERHAELGKPPHESPVFENSLWIPPQDASDRSKTTDPAEHYKESNTNQEVTDKNKEFSQKLQNEISNLKELMKQGMLNQTANLEGQLNKINDKLSAMESKFESKFKKLEEREGSLEEKETGRNN